MQIRRAEPDDAAALAALFEASFAPLREAGLDLPATGDTLSDDIATHLVWVAESNGRLFGGVVASDSMTSLHVMMLAVAPEAQGRGLGQLLMETVETWASQAFISDLRLTTHVDMSATRAFYERIGWSETGREDTRLHMGKTIAVADDDDEDDEFDEEGEAI